MAAEKNILSRIIHKHDIEANWNKATNFIPKAGEIIIYDKDETYDYERFKIGNGETNINDLNFIILQSDWAQNDENALDYVKNRTHYEEGDSLVLYYEIESGGVPENLSLPTGVGEPLVYGREYYIDYWLHHISGESMGLIQDHVVADMFDGEIYLRLSGGQEIWYRTYNTEPHYEFVGFDHSPYEEVGVQIIIDLKGEIVQIDEKYIPDTIARVVDIENEIQLITVEDIDEICGASIVNINEVTY